MGRPLGSKNKRARTEADNLKFRTPLSERFAVSYFQEPNSGCWIWIGSINNKGYGNIGIGGRKCGKVYAHRLSYEYAHGTIPVGLNVLHKCDTPCCVNPGHLFLGTQLDNVRDMIAKGRRPPRNMPRGENHWRARARMAAHV